MGKKERKSPPGHARVCVCLCDWVNQMQGTLRCRGKEALQMGKLAKESAAFGLNLETCRFSDGINMQGAPRSQVYCLKRKGS